MGYFTNSSVDYGNIVCIACDEYGQQGICNLPSRYGVTTGTRPCL